MPKRHRRACSRRRRRLLRGGESVVVEGQAGGEATGATTVAVLDAREGHGRRERLRQQQRWQDGRTRSPPPVQPSSLSVAEVSHSAGQGNSSAYAVLSNSEIFSAITAEMNVPSCTICRKIFVTGEEDEIRDHMHLKHGKDRPYTCTICPKMFKTRDTLNEHQRAHANDRPFGCSFCPKRFKHRGALHLHKDMHLRGLRHCCAFCRKNFTQKSTMDLHVRSVHSNFRGVACQTCGRQFVRQADCLRHMRVHTQIFPYSCQNCSKGFREKNNLVRNHSHSVDQQRIKCRAHFCVRCPMTLKLTHIRTHTGEQPFTCEQCDRVFADRSNKNKHSKLCGKRSKRKQNFTCTVCNKSFLTNWKLKRHERVHSMEKPFRCNFTGCNRRFSDKGNLRTHLGGHTPSFLCVQCCRTFSTKHNLKTHMSAIHGVTARGEGLERFACRVCGKQATSDVSLRMHVRRKHSSSLKALPPGEKIPTRRKGRPPKKKSLAE